MQIVPKKQLINTLKELYNLIRVTSGFKYEGTIFNTDTETYVFIHKDTMNYPLICRLIAYYDSSECMITCRLPSNFVASLNTIHGTTILARFDSFINFLKSIPCIKVTPDKYLKYTYYIQLEDL